LTSSQLRSGASVPTMNDTTGFAGIPPTTLADVLGREQVMDIGIRPLWTPTPRIAGPAFTVKCPPGDNLMLHAAIYRAAPGSVVVVESGDLDYALAGGNVCAIAQRNGIAAFVLDGLIRDLAEVRDMGFPVFARGVIPIPGGVCARHQNATPAGFVAGPLRRQVPPRAISLHHSPGVGREGLLPEFLGSLHVAPCCREVGLTLVSSGDVARRVVIGTDEHRLIQNPLGHLQVSKTQIGIAQGIERVRFHVVQTGVTSSFQRGTPAVDRRGEITCLSVDRRKADQGCCLSLQAGGGSAHTQSFVELNDRFLVPALEVMYLPDIAQGQSLELGQFRVPVEDEGAVEILLRLIEATQPPADDAQIVGEVGLRLPVADLACQVPCAREAGKRLIVKVVAQVHAPQGGSLVQLHGPVAVQLTQRDRLLGQFPGLGTRGPVGLGEGHEAGGFSGRVSQSSRATQGLPVDLLCFRCFRAAVEAAEVGNERPCQLQHM